MDEQKVAPDAGAAAAVAPAPAQQGQNGGGKGQGNKGQGGKGEPVYREPTLTERLEEWRDRYDDAMDYVADWRDWWRQRKAGKPQLAAGQIDSTPLKRTTLYKNLWWMRLILAGILIGYSAKTTVSTTEWLTAPIFLDRSGRQGAPVRDAEGWLQGPFKQVELPAAVAVVNVPLELVGWEIPNPLPANTACGIAVAFLIFVLELALAERNKGLYALVVSIDALYTTTGVYPDIVKPLFEEYIRVDGKLWIWAVTVLAWVIAFLGGLVIAYYGEQIIVGKREKPRYVQGGGQNKGQQQQKGGGGKG